VELFYGKLVQPGLTYNLFDGILSNPIQIKCELMFNFLIDLRSLYNIPVLNYLFDLNLALFMIRHSPSIFL
jgi:hypothetical protein